MSALYSTKVTAIGGRSGTVRSEIFSWRYR